MSDISRPIPACDFRLNLFVEDPGDARGEIPNGDLFAAGDVEGVPVRLLHFERQPARAGDIVDTDEVPELLAIFVDERRIPVQKTRRKNGEYAGVRIGKRLVRSVDIEESQRHGRN